MPHAKTMSDRDLAALASNESAAGWLRRAASCEAGRRIVRQARETVAPRLERVA